jgi:hypothetical protein
LIVTGGAIRQQKKGKLCSVLAPLKTASPARQAIRALKGDGK